MPAAALALVLSVVAAAGSLYLSLGLGLRACPLCFYQRTFAFALVGVLTLGLLSPARRSGALNLLALPLAVGGLGVAAFHVYLELNGTLECPLGVGDVGTAPKQSLAIYVLVTLALAAGVVGEVRAAGYSAVSVVVALALGGAAVYGSVVANPPSPLKGPYPPDQRIETCRPVYKGV